MPGPSPEELSQQEPLVSLNRAREFISNEADLEILDALIVRVVKRLIKKAKRRIDGANEPRQEVITDLDDPFIRECLESPVILSVDELALLLRQQTKSRQNGDSTDR